MIDTERVGYGVFLIRNPRVPLRAQALAALSRAHVRGTPMADARRMGKSELFSHFAERFEVKRTQAREFFDELTTLAEKELKRSGEFVLPGMVKLVKQHRKARMGRNPGDRRSNQDSGKDRRQGQDCQTAERRGSASQVAWQLAPQRGCRVGAARSVDLAAARASIRL